MKKILFLSVFLMALCSKVLAANVLVIGVGYSVDTATATGAIQGALSADGHTVSTLLFPGNTAGAIAADLAAHSYDQIFLIDITTQLLLDPADTAAIASFWNSHRGLVIDTRSYGFIFQPTVASELALIKNVANTFTLTAGGVWIGTDDAPTWAYNGNAILGAIGVNPVTGNYSDPVNYADPTSVLLQNVTPGALWGGGASLGAAPLGVQPNGIEMFLHFGNETNGVITPYIAANFPLAGPPSAAVPVPMNSPWSLILMAGLVLTAVAFQGRRKSERRG